ncbi:MAG: 2-ketogluconate transporter [uncultured Paraburkholderia sp.]|nr:MAG: 2-ketogluconate transporter [uncultured Paraburkholderia sp.]
MDDHADRLLTYSLAYLDRANYGFAAAAGINQDLGISKGLSSLIGALFSSAISSRFLARSTPNAAASRSSCSGASFCGAAARR